MLGGGVAEELMNFRHSDVIKSSKTRNIQVVGSEDTWGASLVDWRIG